MPKVKISEYSATANSNTDVASINIDEGCAPSGINNAIRAVMGHLKDFQQGTYGDPFNGPVNGTVGATTPSTGAFTTLSATGNVTLGDASTDTLNVGNGGLIKDANGTVGVGVTPAAWSLSGLAAVQIKDVSLAGFSNAMYLNNNVYYNGGWKFIGTGYGLQYTADRGAGAYSWNISTASGTAGNAISFTQAMTLDASGNLGIGTTSPSQRLHLNIGSATAIYSRIQNSAGDCYLGLDTSGNTNLSADNAGNQLIFKTQATERARIDSSGNLLVGTTTNVSTDGILHAQSATNKTAVGAYAKGTTSSAVGYYCKTDSANALYAYWNCNGVNTGTISTNGTTTTYGTTSDYRLKTVVGAVTGHGSRIDALEPVEYEWKSNGSRTRGFLAHKFQEVYANSVSGAKDAVDENGNPVYQGMQAGTAEVIADLVAEIQSLRKRLAAAGI